MEIYSYLRKEVVSTENMFTTAVYVKQYKTA